MQSVAERRAARGVRADLVAPHRVTAVEHDAGVAVGADHVVTYHNTRRLCVDAVAAIPERSPASCVDADEVSGDRGGGTEQHPVAEVAADDVAGGKGAAAQPVARA